jgi:hypothetical protein
VNKGQFSAHVEEAWDLLGRLGLTEARNYRPNYSDFKAAEFRNLGHRDAWQQMLRTQLFDFQLADLSLLQFRYARTKTEATPSYVFIQSPVVARPYSDFVVQDLNLRVEDVGDDFRVEWEEELESAKLRDSPLYFRFDYAPLEYRPFAHPCAHLHVGHETGVRIGTRRVLQPMSFALFVLRHVYSEQWVKVVEDNKNKFESYVRGALDGVSKDKIDATSMWLE